MKLMPHLKKGLNLFIKDIRMMVISFLILPMALALVYGNMQKDLFEGKDHSREVIKARFKYIEGTEKGAFLKVLLSQKEIKDFINTESKVPEYTVLISDDFKTAEIKGKDEGTLQFVMLKNFTQTVLNSFNQYETMQNTLNGLSLRESQKQSLMQEAIALMKNKGISPIRESIAPGYKTLGPVEYFTISMFSFTSLILVVTLAGYFYKETKEGIAKRSLSTPNNRRDYFLGFILTSFIVSVLISSVYVFVNRARGAAFSGSPLSLVLIILLQGLMCASAVGTIIAFIKKELTANIIMNLILVVPGIFGGVFFYSEIISSGILKTLINSVPNALILNSFKGLAITGGLGGAQKELIGMAVLSLILLTLSMIKIERNWEV